MSSDGRRWSSQRGIDHARCRSRVSTAGTRVIRTANASTATPTASANAIGWTMSLPCGTNATNTEIMMIAAAVTTRALAVNPTTTARCGSRCRVYSSCIRETRNTS